MAESKVSGAIEKKRQRKLDRRKALREKRVNPRCRV